MKKILLKLRIIFTNLCGAVASFLCICMAASCKSAQIIEPTCYDMPAPMIDELTTPIEAFTPTPQANIGSAPETTFNILLIIIPAAIVTLGIVYIIYRRYKKRKNIDINNDNNTEAED